MKAFLSAVCLMVWAVGAHAQPDNEPGIATVVRVRPAIIEPDRTMANRINNPANVLDTSTPEATVRSFVWALNLVDIKNLSACVDGGLPAEALGEFSEFLNRDRYRCVYLISDLHSYPGNEEAIVTLRLTNLRFNFNRTIESTCERLRLKREENIWKIKAPKEFPDVEEQTSEEDLLIRFAAMGMGGKVESLLSQQARFSLCQSNLKQIGLGIRQFIQDQNQQLALDDDWKTPLVPYLGNAQVFQCPQGSKDQEPFCFNKQLKDAIYGNIANPARTILVYEGKDEKFEYRHLNKTTTNILFADGHVESFTQETLMDAVRNGKVFWK